MESDCLRVLHHLREEKKTTNFKVDATKRLDTAELSQFVDTTKSRYAKFNVYRIGN